MDESSEKLSREQLLKTGGGSAIAALVALAGAGTAAADTPKPRPTTTLEVAIGLDFTGDAVSGKSPKTDVPNAVPTGHVFITSKQSDVPTSGVTVYEMTNPQVTGPVPHGSSEKCDANGHYPKLWVVVYPPAKKKAGAQLRI